MQIMQVMKLLSFYGKSTETLDSMEKVMTWGLFTLHFLYHPFAEYRIQIQLNNFPVKTKGYFKESSALPAIILGEN